MAEPTFQQVETLQNFGIAPPPTKKGCSSLLQFILEYRWGKLDRQQKIALVVSTQTKWIGKRVITNSRWTSYPNPVTGTIGYIVGLSKDSYVDARRRGYKELPFRFYFNPDDRSKAKPQLFRKMALSLITEENEVS